MAAGSPKKKNNLCASRPRIRKDDRLWQSPAGGICSAVVPLLSLSCRAKPNRPPFFLLVHFFGIGCFRSIPVLLYYSCRKHQRSNFDVHQQRKTEACDNPPKRTFVYTLNGKNKWKKQSLYWTFPLHCVSVKSSALMFFICFRSSLSTFMPQTSQTDDHPSFWVWFGPWSSTFRSVFILQGS